MHHLTTVGTSSASSTVTSISDAFLRRRLNALRFWYNRTIPATTSTPTPTSDAISDTVTM